MAQCKYQQAQTGNFPTGSQVQGVVELGGLNLEADKATPGDQGAVLAEEGGDGGGVGGQGSCDQCQGAGAEEDTCREQEQEESQGHPRVPDLGIREVTGPGPDEEELAPQEGQDDERITDSRDRMEGQD